MCHQSICEYDFPRLSVPACQTKLVMHAGVRLGVGVGVGGVGKWDRYIGQAGSGVGGDDESTGRNGRVRRQRCLCRN